MISAKTATQFLGIAYAVAQLSKDKSTKVGAVIIGPSKEIRSTGWNGAPRGCAADEDDRGTTRPEKYFWFSHAELNAITNAAKVGIPLGGSTLICTHPPCMDCSRAIVQAGITHVYVPEWDSDFAVRWMEHISRSRKLFEECGVEYVVLSKAEREKI